MIEKFYGIVTYLSSVWWQSWWQQLMFAPTDLVTSLGERRADFSHKYHAGMILPVLWLSEGLIESRKVVAISWKQHKIHNKPWIPGAKDCGWDSQTVLLWRTGRKSQERVFLGHSKVFAYTWELRKPPT